ncbi:hypothetical protein FRC03_000337 [Tulasnella sp. 419]|nr:hypothetical protein FRC02_008991 [Tulasnella sp. 418]KAG8965642.1 hypothetical protein FRC03_000337 [Tulasnella sp. 419]
MATKIAVIFYSTYGHSLNLAETALNASKEAGADVKLFQIPETLSPEVLTLLRAAPRRTDIPTVTVDDLKDYDGYIFVIPTRYGRAVSQFSSFFDQTGGLWFTQALSKKFATVLTSTGTQNGGQETTAFTTLPFFAHHGINFVPIGYAAPETTNMTEIKGGSPWGTGTLAGPDGSRQPTDLEIKAIESHAVHFTRVVQQFNRGGDRLAAEKQHKTAPSRAVEAVKPTRSSSTPSETSGTSSQKKKKGLWKSIKNAFK